ncbi:MAG: hypothetical protein IPJ58_15260 [Ardenticatenia bacterium]|nr:hypothetical protein [Ardenticatenia bacterium]
MVAHRVACDLVEPVLETGLATVAFHAAQHAGKGIAGQIFSGVMVAHLAQDKTVDGLDMAAVERGQRGLVAAAQARQEQLVGHPGRPGRLCGPQGIRRRIPLLLGKGLPVTAHHVIASLSLQQVNSGLLP